MTTSSLPSPLPFGRPRRPDRHGLPRTRAARTAEASREVARLKADQPEDLLALMPYLLGFHPEESLVMMVISDRVVKVTVRVDLVDDVDGVAERFRAIAVGNQASGVVLVAYSGDPQRADAMLLPVMERLASLNVVEAIYADGRCWWSRSCSGSCCPVEGTPYEAAANRLAAEAVFCGMTAYGDRSELERLADGPPEVDHEVLTDLTDELIGEVLGPELPHRRKRMRQLVADYATGRRHGEPVALSDRERITLALLAIDPRVRDEAWAAIDREDAWIHVELWQQVVSRAVPELAPPALCLLGMAAWIKGQGVLQVCCLERARSLDPGYSMTDILEDINARALPPSHWDGLQDSMREVLDGVYEGVSDSLPDRG